MIRRSLDQLDQEVVNKVASTDNAIVRFDGTTGAVQNSGVIIDDSNNVGIGTSSPGYKVDITNASGGNMVNASYTGGVKNPYIRLGINSDTLSEVSAGNSDNTCALGLKVGGTERMRIDSAGNLGLGVVPSANAGQRTLNVGNYNGTFSAVTAGASGGDYGYIGYNFGTTSETGNYKYLISDFASGLEFKSGGFKFRTAPSGTAGNPIPWTNAMILDANGNLGLGTNSPTQKISVQGNMYSAQSTSMRILDAGDFSGNKPLHHNYIETGSTHWGDNGFMAFGTQNVERMRITDSSVLFGKDVAGQNNIVITAETGAIQAYKSNITMNMPIKLNPEPTGGNVLVGTTTDNGVDKLQVNGSIRASNYVNTFGGVSHFNYYTTLSHGINFVIDFTLLGDDSFDIEVVRGSASSSQFNKFVFTQMAGIGNYVAISDQTGCTVSLISSVANAYRYSLTIPTAGGYTGFAVFIKFRNSTIHTFS